MIRIRFIFFYLLLIALLTSCDNDFDDNLLSQREVADIVFKQVRVNDVFNVVLKQDTDFRVEICAPESTINGIDCFVNGDTLELFDRNPRKWRTGYVTPQVTIYFPTLEYFRAYAPGNISTLGTIAQSNFKVFITRHIGTVNLNVDVENLSLFAGNTDNMGRYIVQGKANYAYFWMRNGCFLDAQNLELGSARVINNSYNNVYINIDSKLRVSLNSSGNVYYRGNPSEIIIEEQSSTGKLIKLQ